MQAGAPVFHALFTMPGMPVSRANPGSWGGSPQARTGAGKPTVTAMNALLTAIVIWLSVNFDLNTWSHFNSASTGLTLGLVAAAPGGVLFGEQVGEPFAIGNLNVSYQVPSRSKGKVTVSFQLRNLFDQRVQETPVQALDVSLRGRETFVKMSYAF